MSAPYRSVYHALGRSLSGITMENYVSSGWQAQVSARVEDSRRLSDFSDGLNTQERNAQDALTLSLIRRTLTNSREYAAVWIYYLQDRELVGVFASYLGNLLAIEKNVPVSLAVQVLKEWAGHTNLTFRQFCLMSKLSLSTSYRDRSIILDAAITLHDDAIDKLRPEFQTSKLISRN